MIVQVLFFGATADFAGKRFIKVEMPDEAIAKDVLDRMISDVPQLASQKLHISLNQQFATGEEIIRDGDEIAIFTHVSGG